MLSNVVEDDNSSKPHMWPIIEGSFLTFRTVAMLRGDW